MNFFHPPDISSQNSVKEEDVVKMRNSSTGLISPFRALVCGPSSCGKSELILSLLENHESVFNVDFKYIFYFYPQNALTESRKIYVDKMRKIFPNLQTVEGVPEVSNMATVPGHKLMILDDMYEALTRNKNMLETMILGSHHSNWSVIVTSQSYFMQNIYAKTFIRNFTDQIIFDSKSERQSFEIISRQMFPHLKHFLPNIMQWMRKNIKNPYDRYVWIDCHPNNEIDELYRIRTGIVPMEEFLIDCQLVYQPKINTQ